MRSALCKVRLMRSKEHGTGEVAENAPRVDEDAPEV